MEVPKFLACHETGKASVWPEEKTHAPTGKRYVVCEWCGWAVVLVESGKPENEHTHQRVPMEVQR